MARNITVGIDVGTRSTRVAVAEYAKGSTSSVILGVGVVPSKGLRHGYIINGADAAKSVRAAAQAAEQSSGIKIRSAYLSIGGISLGSAIARGSTRVSRIDNEVTGLDIQNVIEACREHLSNIANKRVIYTIPLQFKIDGKEIPGRPQGMIGKKLDAKVLFITCLEQHIDDMISTVEEAGIEVEEIVAAPIAASLVALNKKQRAVGCLLANIGAETVSVAVFEDDIPISLHVFPIGSTDITNDIALGLRVPLEEAEHIKISGAMDTYPKQRLDEIIEARLSDIFELIESHLKKIGRDGLLPGGVILTGGGAGLSTMEDFARVALRLPAKIAIPDILRRKGGNIPDSSWFVAYGLCIYGFRYSHKKSFLAAISGTMARAVSWMKQFLP